MKKRYLAVMAATMTTMAVTACSGNQTTTETTAVETTTACSGWMIQKNTVLRNF